MSIQQSLHVSLVTRVLLRKHIVIALLSSEVLSISGLMNAARRALGIRAFTDYLSIVISPTDKSDIPKKLQEYAFRHGVERIFPLLLRLESVEGVYAPTSDWICACLALCEERMDVFQNRLVMALSVADPDRFPGTTEIERMLKDVPNQNHLSMEESRAHWCYLWVFLREVKARSIIYFEDQQEYQLFLNRCNRHLQRWERTSEETKYYALFLASRYDQDMDNFLEIGDSRAADAAIRVPTDIYLRIGQSVFEGTQRFESPVASGTLAALFLSRYPRPLRIESEIAAVVNLTSQAPVYRIGWLWHLVRCTLMQTPDDDVRRLFVSTLIEAIQDTTKAQSMILSVQMDLWECILTDPVAILLLRSIEDASIASGVQRMLTHIHGHHEKFCPYCIGNGDDDDGERKKEKGKCPSTFVGEFKSDGISHLSEWLESSYWLVPNTKFKPRFGPRLLPESLATLDHLELLIGTYLSSAILLPVVMQYPDAWAPQFWLMALRVLCKRRGQPTWVDRAVTALSWILYHEKVTAAKDSATFVERILEAMKDLVPYVTTFYSRSATFLHVRSALRGFDLGSYTVPSRTSIVESPLRRLSFESVHPSADDWASLRAKPEDGPKRRVLPLALVAVGEDDDGDEVVAEEESSSDEDED